MTQVIGELLGVSVMAAGMVVGGLVFVTGLLIPLMAVTITLNIRSMRIQLERLVNAVEARPGA